MKIEIISGTKDEPPTGYNTIIKINGKKTDLIIDELYFKVKADEVASYGFLLKGNKNFKNKIIYFFKRILFKIKKVLK